VSFITLIYKKLRVSWRCRWTLTDLCIAFIKTTFFIFAAIFKAIITDLVLFHRIYIIAAKLVLSLRTVVTLFSRRVSPSRFDAVQWSLSRVLSANHSLNPLISKGLFLILIAISSCMRLLQRTESILLEALNDSSLSGLPTHRFSIFFVEQISTSFDDSGSMLNWILGTQYLVNVSSIWREGKLGWVSQKVVIKWLLELISNGRTNHSTQKTLIIQIATWCI
jgi:hypothetical protein